MDYKYIRAWGRMLGSFQTFIEGEVEQARQDNAPQTAVYRDADGVWQTFESVKREDTKAKVQAIVDGMEDG